MYLSMFAPPAGLGAVRLDVRRASVLVRCGVRHRQVAGQQVVERRDVGRALDRRVAAQRHDAAAGPADVAEQQLQDRRRADVSARRRCAASSRRRSRTPSCARGRSCRTASRRPRGTAVGAAAADVARPSRACSARSGAAGSGRRSAGAAASVVASAARRSSMPPRRRGARRLRRRARAGRRRRAPRRPRTASSSGRSSCRRGSKPEKRPSRSSVSWKSSSTIVARVRVVERRTRGSHGSFSRT